jgi:hypothetical protein
MRAIASERLGFCVEDEPKAARCVDEFIFSKIGGIRCRGSMVKRLSLLTLNQASSVQIRVGPSFVACCDACLRAQAQSRAGPSFVACCRDAASRLKSRDQNRPCGLFWSLLFNRLTRSAALMHMYLKYRLSAQWYLHCVKALRQFGILFGEISHSAFGACSAFGA